MEEIRKKSLQAAEYLLGVPQQWSKHQFEREVMCDHNTSNFVESFNALINELKEKPVLQLLEGIRTYFMEKYSEKREVAEKLWRHDLTPYAQGILDSNASDSRFCVAINGGHGELEVSEGTQPFPIDLTKHTCLCGYWQVTGLPCKYACRAIYYSMGDPKRYVHSFYSADNYKNTYLNYMHPMPNEDAWSTFPFPHVFPPISERGIGRPARQRKRKPDEPRKGKRSVILRCSICQTLRHNARSCHGGPTARQKKAVAQKKRKNEGPVHGAPKRKAKNDEHPQVI
ncbi:uncharacterized protein LOC141641841 [Silene latifolia]|uniref:uncharacterized protein LOC141641841 n=1 Tax=Silene latifolia TaxID=37657 RepID=UPI003D77B8F7